MDEIARTAGVSKATVDRVLNNRPGVQEHTRKHVLAIVAELAGTLSPDAQQSRIRLDFVLPGGENAFITDLAREIERQVELRGDVDVVVHRLNGITPEEIAAKLGSLRPTTQGVALIGLDSPSVREAVRKLVAAGIPVLTLVSDISHVGRVNYVGIDNRAAGRLAGYLIGRFLPGSAGKVALIAGALAYRGHEEREMGFRHVLQESFPRLNIVAAREVQEDAGRAYSEVRALLAEHDDLVAIYCIGAGHEGIARALTEAGRENAIVFIGHDLTEDTRQFLLSGVMDAAIDQNARVEAREAVDRLVRAVRNESNVSTATVRIQSVFRENIPNEP
ncbi:LacI family DNA-binding transcriptional regulator [Mesorhizobium sp. LHD-90]|uniref:LacI family DNA-binding transcriptional regulator n=1 Tax=Mesorhizobium sp. LHD-90 TaxID=3071414 RepID=UPI0027E1F02B|nr:LacI family DNA-binding transcriptional regulator [Mesorhizobium sp. LHD-90]MDQ6433793.1 LacI family DNA-binding transcriptional regulator [Mesorhizobium sp. LHD-90]